MRALGIGGIDISYQGYKSYDDMVADMGSGVIDAAFPVGGGLYYSEENGIYQSTAVVSAPTELVFYGTFKEDTASQFAVNENNRMQYYYVLTNYPDAKIVLYPSIDDCLAAVLSGKAKCTTLNGLRANDILRNRKYENLSLRQSGKSDDRCFGVEIGNEGLLKLLNRGINVLGSDYAQNISYRYSAGLYSYGAADMLMDHMAVFGLAVLAVAALVIFLLIRDSRRTRSANRAKTVFLNNMSHDIRTPMNAIIGFTKLASSHLDDREQVKEYLERISVSGEHLLALINDVLDMSRIESGKMTLEEAPVHLPDVIGDLCTIVRQDAAEKNILISVDAKDIVHEDVTTDRLRLDQILLNILSNAVKFTPEGGTVHFTVEENASSEDTADYIFRIRDNGIGMSEEFRKTIFEAFTRERTSTVSGIRGTGLGMAITKNIVDKMGGVISVDSEEGKGSEFTVKLPFRFGEKPAVRAEMKNTDIDVAGKRVLLAEDNEMNQMIAQAILTDAGLYVEIAGDGSEAVERIEEAPAGYYDIILMDIQMPRMDGYEATRRIRSLPDPEKAGIPIVAVTANAFEEDRNEALKSGMDAHLAKPYDVTAIMETLDRLFKRR